MMNYEDTDVSGQTPASAEVAEYGDTNSAAADTAAEKVITLSAETYLYATHKRFVPCEADGERRWVYDGSPTPAELAPSAVTPPEVILRANSEELLTAEIHIRKDRLSLPRCRLTRAELILWQHDPGSSSADNLHIRLGGQEYPYLALDIAALPITESYLAAEGELILPLSLAAADPEAPVPAEGGAEAYCLFTGMTVRLSYLPLGERTEKKSFTLGGGATAEADILYGSSAAVLDTLTDPVLGVSVRHIHKPGEDGPYGNGYRLNLDERLEKISGSDSTSHYLYTDPYGDTHTFREYFYRIDANGEKAYIYEGQDAITADADGRLWLDGTEVFRELLTEDGLRATARLDKTVNNTEWVDERLDEEKKIEEQYRSYRKALLDLYMVEKETGKAVSCLTAPMLDDPDKLEGFLQKAEKSANLLLPAEEVPAYCNALAQRDSLTVSVEALAQQIDAFPTQQKAYTLQLESIESSVRELLARFRDPYEIDNPISEEELRAQVNNFVLDGTSPYAGEENGFLTRQYENVAAQLTAAEAQQENTVAQLEVAETQLENAKAQLELYLDRSGDYIRQYKIYYTEYRVIEEQYAAMRVALPVAFLHADGLVKGFNTAGELVLLGDAHGNMLSVERESLRGETATRITGVVDRKERRMRFAYNGNGRLAELISSTGEVTRMRYDTAGCLIHMERTGYPSLTLQYTAATAKGHLSRIDFSDRTTAELSYTADGKWARLSLWNEVGVISHGVVTAGSSNAPLGKTEMTYTETETVFTYDGIRSERYVLSPDTEQIVAHYELTGGKVTAAEWYAYTGRLLTGRTSAHKSCLGQHTYEEFASRAVVGVESTTAYNSFDAPVSVETTRYAVPRYEGGILEKTRVEYTYDGEHRPIRVRTIRTVYNPACPEEFETAVGVETYSYAATGEMIRKESYLEGEELKTGINIEEHVFNDKGVEVQSFSYNSLDPSSKCYTENEVDENGKTLAAFDESGEHKTTFDYERDGATVKTERLPNGSKFSYGRDKDGTVSAITHSTGEGEENSTTQNRTLGMVTEVKSGNNTVRYTYDEKRRMKSVSLNGVDDYVTYTYGGEHTDNETVVATMADDTVARTVKDLNGNVTLAACDDRNVNNTYDNEQKLTRSVDSVSGETAFTYNAEGNVTAVTAPDHSEEFARDSLHPELVTRKTITVGGVPRIYTYTYKPTADKALDSMTVDGKTVKPKTDALGRNVGKTIEVGEQKPTEEKISYIKFGDHATSLPSNVRFATNGVFNESIQYKYDSMGNIIEVFENGRSACRYEYDALGRLTREDNVAFGKTTTWAYDNNGNITAKYEYALTAKPTNELHLLDGTCKLYTYDVGSDKLILYDGEEMVYDTIGNPTTYRGESAAWEYGRELTEHKGCTFAYDARGRRISKQKEGETAITFTYDASGNLIKQSNGLEFLYDHTGVFAVKYDGSTYFYRKNAQNDIIALLDSTGSVVVKYNYDAWGNCKALNADGSVITDEIHIGILNPFRYRSYYYDTETNLYFLKSRYYDPEIGRFMTIDDISYLDPDSINGLNLYAYCGNNPIMYSDPNGTLKWYHWLGIIGAVIVVAAATVLTCGAAGIAIGGAGLAGAVIHGAAVGALIGAGIGIAGGAIAGGIYSAVTGADFWSSVGAGAMAGFGIGAIIGAVVGGFAGASGWYNARALEFTNLGTNDEVVLGKYIRNSKHSYDAVAKSRGSTYFGTSESRWAEVQNMFGVKEKGMWKINKAFLKQQIKAGKQFVTTNDIIFDHLFKEVSYITSKGISLFLI